jgi:hypothetical protein
MSTYLGKYFFVHQIPQGRNHAVENCLNLLSHDEVSLLLQGGFSTIYLDGINAVNGTIHMPLLFDVLACF